MGKRHREPHWVERVVVDAVHLDQLREHGGLPGIRDENALESALGRPRNQWHCGAAADVATLAAAYGWGLANNHPYRDGNKRIAFMIMLVFVRKINVRFAPDPAEATAMVMSLAAGEVSEESLARWIRDNWPKL